VAAQTVSPATTSVVDLVNRFPGQQVFAHVTGLTRPGPAWTGLDRASGKWLFRAARRQEPGVSGLLASVLTPLTTATGIRLVPPVPGNGRPSRPWTVGGSISPSAGRRSSSSIPAAVSCAIGDQSGRRECRRGVDILRIDLDGNGVYGISVLLISCRSR